MTVLVTGSAGHLGEALLRTLVSGGTPVRGIDVRPSSFTAEVGSICDRDFLRRCLYGVQAVIHAAALHKPHLATHEAADFTRTNVTGTALLLAEAAAARVTRVVFTSSTSAFGSALTPGPGQPAAWITEAVTPITKNVYGATKLEGEALCERAFDERRLPVVVLRTSRFFPEDDDDSAVRQTYARANVQANELLFRRVDLEDVVSAHLQALRRAPDFGFARFIVSATTPFSSTDLAELRAQAHTVLARVAPAYQGLYAARGWRMFPSIDRVYVNEAARARLGWQPRYDFAHVLRCLGEQGDFHSELSRLVGVKGYHEREFAHGPYPVARGDQTASPRASEPDPGGGTEDAGLH
jgi:UDP-glucose 4-epimerase